MTTTITLPEALAQQLQQRAVLQHRTPEALAIALIEAGLMAPSAEAARSSADDDPELLALVARVKALPPNPDSIIPAQGRLAEVLTALEAVPDAAYDLEAELAALRAAAEELHALNRADDIAEGRG